MPSWIVMNSCGTFLAVSSLSICTERAYGTKDTDVPYVLTRLTRHSEIPLWLRFRRFYNLFANHLNWVFLPLLLMFGASVPLWVSTDFSLTDLGQTLWSASGILLSTTLSTVVFFMYFEYLILPPKPARWPF